MVAATDKPTRSTGLIGASGEYYVAAELSLRGWLATPTIKNAPGTDVLAQHLSTGRVVAIQSKTASVGNDFTLGAKDETPTLADNEWYALVSLQGLGARPVFYVVPRNHIAGALYAGHRAWLARPSRSGRPHVDNPRRTIPAAELTAYRERWELLEASSEQVPLSLPSRHLDYIRDFGLPQGHPGPPAESPSNRRRNSNAAPDYEALSAFGRLPRLACF